MFELIALILFVMGILELALGIKMWFSDWQRNWNKHKIPTKNHYQKGR